MLEKLKEIYNRYKEIEQEMNDPEVISDMKKFIRLNKDYKELQPIVDAYGKYKKMHDDMKGAKDILNTEKDEDLRSMAKEEVSELTQEMEEMEEKIRMMLVPTDPQDKKNAVVEIRAAESTEPDQEDEANRAGMHTSRVPSTS